MNSVGAIVTYTFHLYRSEDYPSEHHIMFRILAYSGTYFHLERKRTVCAYYRCFITIAYFVLHLHRFV